MKIARWTRNTRQFDSSQTQYDEKAAHDPALSRLRAGFHLGGKPLTREQSHERL